MQRKYSKLGIRHPRDLLRDKREETQGLVDDDTTNAAFLLPCYERHLLLVLNNDVS